jgi:hypothetical protein
VLSFISGHKFYSNWATGGTRTAHVASAPGQAPSVETGELLASVSHHIGVSDTVYGIVGSPLLTALFMEKGTHREDGSIGDLPRPFLVPALEIVCGGEVRPAL